MALLLSALAGPGVGLPLGLTVTAGASETPPPLSIVQLGDSVASGEGTLYDYRYDTKSREWVGGDIDAKWPVPYPLCHTSPDAYGALVAADLEGTFHQFACTGASFDNGITTPRVNKGYISDTQLRPAEFGNWDTRTDLNANYDADRPGLVLVTMGADDVQFVAIVEACIENGYKHAIYGAKLECTAANPGATVTTDFTGYLPTLVSHYQTLAGWIAARGKADGLVPKVVFTDYMDPLPASGHKCPDSSWLYPEQTDYLRTLLDQLNSTIETTITGLHDPGVAVADISHALDGHQWCTDDPWDYGLSIYKVDDPDSFESQAPFHPTPEGQQAIAARVAPVARRLLGD